MTLEVLPGTIPAAVRPRNRSSELMVCDGVASVAKSLFS